MKLNEKSRGLGDTIEKFTTATGIKNVVTKVTKQLEQKIAGVVNVGILLIEFFLTKSKEIFNPLK